MAVDWIKMRVNLEDDPRVLLIAQMLGCNAVSVIGGLYVLWTRGDQHSADGILKGYTPTILDKKFGKEGFAKALSHPDVGWLEIGPNYLNIIDFHKHNGASAKKRSQAAERVKQHRTRNANSVTEALPEEDKKKSNTSPNGDVQRAAENAVAPSETDQPAKTRREPSGDHAEFKRVFSAEWKARYGSDYRFARGKDDRHIKWILDAVLRDGEEAKKIVKVYLADAEEWLIDNGHQLGTLVSQFNKFRVRTSEQFRRPNASNSTTGGKRQRSATSRGEFTSTIPVVGRVLGGDGPDEEADGTGVGADPFPDAPDAD